MNKIFVENRTCRNILAMSLNYQAKPIAWVKEELKHSIKDIKAIKKYYKSGQCEEQNNWDCGRQDAFGCRVDQAFIRFRALRIAYKMQSDDATEFYKCVNQMIGND